MTVPAPLRILLLDDNPDDRALVVRTLSGEFPGVGIVEAIDAASLERVLAAGGFDLVITDFHLHWTDGLKNLSAVKGRHPRIPVIMFTGTGTEETAVAAMKAGLDDYVLKSPKHFGRLAAAVRSVMDKRRDQESREEAEEALKASEERYRSLLKGVADEVILLDPLGKILFANDAATVSLGEGEALAEKNIGDFFPPEKLRCWLEILRKVIRTLRPGIYVDWRGGRYLESVLSPLLAAGGRAAGVTVVSRDITDRKQAEEALRESEEKHRQVVDNASEVIV
ncbi:MAG: response regulator, partial [Candidatus Aureabacteria bacterium]|nr:response regulator [Candidatus Auribacterota bacterium]